MIFNFLLDVKYHEDLIARVLSKIDQNMAKICTSDPQCIDNICSKVIWMILSDWKLIFNHNLSDKGIITVDDLL